MELYRSTIIQILPKSCEEITKNQKNLGKKKEFMSELYSFSKATQFFRKPLYQSSPNAVPLIPFVNGKFKLDDNFFQNCFHLTTPHLFLVYLFKNIKLFFFD